ncbi:MAG: phosphoribosylanthranilate isomerase [Elainella sp.]
MHSPAASSLNVKICGITQPDQGQAIAQLGATALGFICVPQSPRYVTPVQIRTVVEALQPEFGSVSRIGVFVDASLAEIQQVVEQGDLTGVQLHGSESPQFCQQLRALFPQLTLIKAFRVRDAATLAQTQAYQTLVDALLLDAFHPAAHAGEYGGTGHTIAWEMLNQFRPNCNWFLAGGITPDNLHLALNWVQPQGIDVSSGVELAPGQKDLTLVKRLLARVAELTAQAKTAQVKTGI